MLRTHDATLPRIKAPEMVYGVSESDRSLHELTVDYIDRELDVAILSFKDAFTIAKPNETLHKKDLQHAPTADKRCAGVQRGGI